MFFLHLSFSFNKLKQYDLIYFNRKFCFFVGKGLFSKKFIPKNSFLGIYRGVVIPADDDSLAEEEDSKSSCSYDFQLGNIM